MSDKDSARRSRAEVFFDGVDISETLGQSLISMTYTDNEEDETDDLQIKIHDRESVWLCKWLNKAVHAAAETVDGLSVTGTTYKVIPQIGLNIRSGPGSGYSKLGTLAYGAAVQVQLIERGWAELLHNGKKAYVSAKYIKPDSGKAPPTSTAGLRIQAAIVRKNWNGDGKDQVLTCGQFELDSVDASGPPASITIKGTSLPFSSQIRQTNKSKAWEAYKLSGIAQEMAMLNGMACLYECADDPFYDRVEQFKTSDIHFLSTLCHDAGISLKATNNIIVLFDQATYEAKAPVYTVRRENGNYAKYKLNTGKAATQYTSCRVRYTDPVAKKLIEAVAYVERYDDKKKDNQRLELTAKVSSIAEAKNLAEKRLRLHNKYAKTASFTLPGTPNLMAGITVKLENWGLWDGTYLICQAAHTVGSSGYTTQIAVRGVLEGY